MTLEYQKASAGTKYRKYLLLIGILFVLLAAVHLWHVKDGWSAALHRTSTQRSTFNQFELWYQLSAVIGHAATQAMLAGLLCWVGMALLRLQRWARVWAVAISAWGCLFAISNLPIVLYWPWQFSPDAQSFASTAALEVGRQIVLPVSICVWIVWFLRRPEVISAIHEMDHRPSRSETIALPVFTTAVITAAIGVGSLLMLPRILLSLTTEPGWLSTIAFVRSITMLILLFATTRMCLSRPNLGWWAALLTLIAILAFSGMSAFVMLRPELAYTDATIRRMRGDLTLSASAVLIRSATEVLTFALGLCITRKAFANTPQEQC